jgi:hypothetical protein
VLDFLAISSGDTFVLPLPLDDDFAGVEGADPSEPSEPNDVK